MQDARFVEFADDGENLDDFGPRVDRDPGQSPRFALDPRLHLVARDERENVVERVQAAQAVENALQLGVVGMGGHGLPLPSGIGVAVTVPAAVT